MAKNKFDDSEYQKTNKRSRKLLKQAALAIAANAKLPKEKRLNRDELCKDLGIDSHNYANLCNGRAVFWRRADVEDGMLYTPADYYHEQQANLANTYIKILEGTLWKLQAGYSSLSEGAIKLERERIADYKAELQALNTRIKNKVALLAIKELGTIRLEVELTRILKQYQKAQGLLHKADTDSAKSIASLQRKKRKLKAEKKVKGLELEAKYQAKTNNQRTK